MSEMNDRKYDSYMTDKIGPFPFCPGCSHTSLLKDLDKALVKLQLDPKKVVVVTDIGCIGLSDRYFTTNAFHGLHGRSITYACGLKLANPELTVIALKGDGGCGIGGAHFLNVARRNIGITLIVGNNFNYGMTGGQHSVTTPAGGITSTTPWGNPEGPMDLCGTAVAAGAPWVCRATAFDADLSDTFATAIEQPGFAMVEVWELCTAYYMPRNKFKKKELLELVESYGYTLGLQVDKPRPEYTVHYREMYEAGKKAKVEKPPITKQTENNVRKQTGIVVAGSAGQKIISTATLFAEGSMFAGLNVTQKDDYPITVQTGHSVAEIIVSPETIDYTGISSPDYFLLISEDGLKRTRARVEKLPATCTLIADASISLPETKAKVVQLDFSEVAKKSSKLSVATGALAAMLELSGMFPVDAFTTAIKTFQSEKIAEINLQAVDAGVELINNE